MQKLLLIISIVTVIIVLLLLINRNKENLSQYGSYKTSDPKLFINDLYELSPENKQKYIDIFNEPDSVHGGTRYSPCKRYPCKTLPYVFWPKIDCKGDNCKIIDIDQKYPLIQFQMRNKKTGKDIIFSQDEYLNTLMKSTQQNEINNELARIRGDLNFQSFKPSIFDYMRNNVDNCREIYPNIYGYSMYGNRLFNQTHPEYIKPSY